MRIELYLDNEWLEITTNTDPSLQTIGRADEAFGLGEFKAYINRNKNIPPYTPLRFENNGIYDYYLCSSTCYKYLTYNGLHVHDISVLELTAILECFILGSKNFSAIGMHALDNNKLSFIIRLIEQKYNVKFNYNFANKFSQKQEFTFGAGTSMYDPFTEIMTPYNCRPIVKSFDSNTNTFNIDYIDLANGQNYTLNEDNILNIIYSQNIDNYCNILEGEFQNVIERNELTKVYNLTCRSDDIRISADESYLKLPTRAEQIYKFEINVKQNNFFSFNKIPAYAFDNKYKDASGNVITGVVDTFVNFANYIVDDTSDISMPLYWYYNNVIVPNGWYFNTNWKFYIQAHSSNSASSSTLYYNIVWQPTTEEDLLSYKAVDITDRLLEKSQYELLPVQEQPKYAYYTKGQYEIKGMYVVLNDDFWSQIGSIFGGLGKVGPFLNYINTDAISSQKGEYYLNNNSSTGQMMIYEVYYTTPSENPIKSTFNVQYKAMVDMQLISYKTKTPFNEQYYKNYARTYSANANFIDFDRLHNAIQKNNDMLGTPDLSIEYNLVNQNAPLPTNQIMFDNKIWYVASVVRNYTMTLRTCVINLVEDYSKVAEAIGVKTQFESTKNPLENIIDRNIYAETVSNITPDDNHLFIKFDFKFADDTNKVLYKRPAILKHSNSSYYVVEALDQYTFDTQGQGSTADMIHKNVGYVDSNNECLSFKATLGYIEELTYNESFTLPEFNGVFEETIVFKEQEIYKDSRERLIFTFKVINAKI